MNCKWCLNAFKEEDMNCPHQCKSCFKNGFRTVCTCKVESLTDDNMHIKGDNQTIFIDTNDAYSTLQQLKYILAQYPQLKEKAKKWNEHESLQHDPRLTKFTLSLVEINALLRLKQRIKDRIDSLYKYDDVLAHEQAEYLEQLLNGDSTS